MENGRRVVKPMRHHCRPSGKPAFYDEKYPGTDCARRNNLCRFWKGQYGYTHGLVLVDAFYEYVAQPDGTDDPPLEIAEAGHDRCPVPIKPENIDAWLNLNHAAWMRQTRFLRTSCGRITHTDRQQPSSTFLLSPTARHLIVRSVVRRPLFTHPRCQVRPARISCQ